MRKLHLILALSILFLQILRHSDFLISTDQIAVSELPSDPESKLAMGQKMTFSSLELFDLELIPGISDKLGKEILDKKQIILSYAAKLECKDLYKSLMHAHGVGSSNALKFIKYLELREDTPCV